MTNDDLLEELASLDPADAESPTGGGAPMPGSERATAILRRATESTPPAAHRLAHRPRSRRALVVGVAAATVALVATVAVATALRPTPANATATVRMAASNTRSATSFRASLKQVSSEGAEESHAEVGPSGMSVTDVDGDPVFTVVNDTYWFFGPDGTATAEDLSPADQAAPFAEASAAVITAALEGGTVTELGNEMVRGTSTEHYRIVLDDVGRAAMADLEPGQLSWFELEYPEEVRSIDVWVANNLVRRLRTESNDWDEPSTPVLTTTEFYDFGAPIEITAPR